MSDSEDNVIEIDNNESSSSSPGNSSGSGEKSDLGFNCKWGESNPCWGINCEPCCGAPCNLGDGCKCCLCFTCCGWCVLSELYASQLDQDCALINHCCCLSYALTCIRHNSRIQGNIGNTSGGWVGDCFMSHICFLCSLGQTLRNEPDPEKYFGWFDNLQAKGLMIMNEDFNFYIGEPH
eukprot:TRINITY_DN268_c0_g1_i1.p1 TRINITY_DN268_c0_g1~~TRINITY_DN268_c0_g1_i1.p1  ORF type:complete len:179 (+),score=43.01 TRINITY_DN268_c0_g1_i1:99-635(+)